MIGESELRIARAATPADVCRFRHALGSFLAVFAMENTFVSDVLVAVGEVLANAVEHGCAEGDSSDIKIVARVDDTRTITVDVHDAGQFLERERQPNRGFGLRIVRAIASDVTIDTSRGTHVRMVFTNLQTA